MNEEGQRLLGSVGHVNGDAVESTPSLGSFGTLWLSSTSERKVVRCESEVARPKGASPTGRKVRQESGDDLLLSIRISRRKFVEEKREKRVKYRASCGPPCRKMMRDSTGQSRGWSPRAGTERRSPRGSRILIIDCSLPSSDSMFRIQACAKSVIVRDADSHRAANTLER